MPFRFEITGVLRARRPVVCLSGWLREGKMRTSDTITIPYKGGSSVTRCIIDILRAHHKQVGEVNSVGLDEQIGIAVNDVDLTRVQIGGIATGSDDAIGN
jgi:hypothetical protein